MMLSKTYQRRHFTPFVVSTDGLLGREASTFAKRLAQKLAIKWQRSYSQVCGYVNARLSIAIIRATHLCLRGSRIPAHKMSNKFPLWEDLAGLALFERSIKRRTDEIKTQAPIHTSSHSHPQRKRTAEKLVVESHNKSTRSTTTSPKVTAHSVTKPFVKIPIK
jgi:hypothetical protein